MKLLSKRIKPQDYVRTWWVATIEAGVTREDVLEPDFWSYVSIDFKPYDRIEVRTDDSEWFGEYIVMSCDRTFAVVHELTHYKLGTEVDVSGHLAYEYFWGGSRGLSSIL